MVHTGKLVDMIDKLCVTTHQLGTTLDCMSDMDHQCPLCLYHT